MKLRVITIDDEPLARERMSTLVEASQDLQLVGEAANGLEALDLITSLDPDLVFIDIEMPELSGFGVISSLDPERVPGVVFITAYEHYAVKAFEVGAIDYLSKPVLPERFAAAVTRAKERLLRRSEEQKAALVASARQADRERGVRTRFVVRRGNAHYFVPADEVDWIDAADNYLQLHSGDRTHLWRGTMKDAEDQLDPAKFIRVHWSAIVAVNRIGSISMSNGSYVIELRSGMRLRSSRNYADRVR